MPVEISGKVWKLFTILEAAINKDFKEPLLPGMNTNKIWQRVVKLKMKAMKTKMLIFVFLLGITDLFAQTLYVPGAIVKVKCQLLLCIRE